MGISCMCPQVRLCGKLLAALSTGKVEPALVLLEVVDEGDHAAPLVGLAAARLGAAPARAAHVHLLVLHQIEG